MIGAGTGGDPPPRPTAIRKRRECSPSHGLSATQLAWRAPPRGLVALRRPAAQLGAREARPERPKRSHPGPREECWPESSGRRGCRARRQGRHLPGELARPGPARAGEPPAREEGGAGPPGGQREAARGEGLLERGGDEGDDSPQLRGVADEHLRDFGEEIGEPRGRAGDGEGISEARVDDDGRVLLQGAGRGRLHRS